MGAHKARNLHETDALTNDLSPFGKRKPGRKEDEGKSSAFLPGLSPEKNRDGPMAWRWDAPRACAWGEAFETAWVSVSASAWGAFALAWGWRSCVRAWG